MKVIKKYILVEFSTEKINNEQLNLKLTLGNIEGYYDSLDYPKYEFDTEEEAIQEAFKRSKYKEYLIIPKISFDIYD